MSYCRVGDDSDVYVLCTGDGWECHLPQKYWDEYPDRSLFSETRVGMLKKLLELQSKGLMVPERCINRLRNEIVQEALDRME